MSGFYHAGRGHEGTEVAAVMDLRPDDYLLYDHRILDGVTAARFTAAVREALELADDKS